MATVLLPQRAGTVPLENGDHLDQPTFHERYIAMPEHTRAELIDGIVYMAAAQKRPHGRYQAETMAWLLHFESATPGVEVLVNTTQILGPTSEPEPDAALIILPELGGKTREGKDGFMVGPPELAVEISASSESIDLNSKLGDYERYGVTEYLVVAVRRSEVFWFVRSGKSFRRLRARKDGVLRSRVFPGLWLDPDALLARRRREVRETLDQGLASPAHRKFAAMLAQRAK